MLHNKKNYLLLSLLICFIYSCNHKENVMVSFKINPLNKYGDSLLIHSEQYAELYIIEADSTNNKRLDLNLHEPKTIWTKSNFFDKKTIEVSRNKEYKVIVQMNEIIRPDMPYYYYPPYTEINLKDSIKKGKTKIILDLFERPNLGYKWGEPKLLTEY